MTRTPLSDLEPADSVALFDSATALVGGAQRRSPRSGVSPSRPARPLRPTGPRRRAPTLAATPADLYPGRSGGGHRPGPPGGRRPGRRGPMAERPVPPSALPGGVRRVQQRRARPPRGCGRRTLAAGHGAGPGVQGRRPEPADRRPRVRPAARARPAGAQPRRGAAPHARPGPGRADGVANDLLPDEVAAPADGVRGLLGLFAAAGCAGDHRRRPVELAGGPGRRAARVPAGRPGRDAPTGLPGPAAHPDHRRRVAGGRMGRGAGIHRSRGRTGAERTGAPS